MKYHVNIYFSTRVKRTERVLEIAECFGLGLDDKEFVVFDHLDLDIDDGAVVFITGQSGAGKSLLLRELARQMADRGRKMVNIDDVVLDPDLPVIDQVGANSNDAAQLLNIVGVNDANLYLRRPGELSDGQRYRMKLAKMIEAKAEVWVADEFMAMLDRTTAKVIAFAMQRAARRVGATLLVATTHLDLQYDLYPSLVIEKRYREKVRTEAFADAVERALTAPCTKADLYALVGGGLA